MAALDDTRIMTKSSGTPGEVPTQGDLYVGELAVNLADRKIYTRNVGGQIIELGGATGPELPNYDPLFQIVAVDTTVTGVYGSGSPLTLQVPPGVEAGDLAIAFVYVRCSVENVTENIGITQSQLAPLLEQQEYVGDSSTNRRLSYRAWSGTVDGALIASGIEITTDNDPADFWWTIYYIRNGEIVSGSVTSQDTTAAGQSAPAAGAEVTGESVLPGNVALLTAHNLYAFPTTSGVRITGAEEVDETLIRGPFWAAGVVRRNSTYSIAAGNFDHKIGVLNSSESSATLTEGFHLMRVDVRGNLTAVTSVNGETGAVSLGIQDMDDFELNPVGEYDFLWETKLASGGANLPGEWGTNSVRWAATDSEGTAYSTTGTQQFWISPDKATWTEVNGDVIHYTVDNNNYYYILNSSTLTDQINNEGWVNLYLTFTDPANHSLTDDPLEEGDILQWNNADQKFRPSAPENLFTEVDGGTFGSG